MREGKERGKGEGGERGRQRGKKEKGMGIKKVKELIGDNKKIKK